MYSNTWNPVKAAAKIIVATKLRIAKVRSPVIKAL
jgi:hypothetical protein